eukprot:comp11509_c0_seq1/m.5956 comp11509_c0_seq1/g.5956  ORF comp11509_c0_seq1/g.5956 comp11509_c0_seq1/m.5956 type:complete len:183 (-) comp11509_c0_seq1:28-576(-)
MAEAGTAKRHILVAVDGSPMAKMALQWTQENFLRPDDFVTLFLAFEVPLSTPSTLAGMTFGMGGSEELFIVRDDDQERAEIEDARRELSAGYTAMAGALAREAGLKEGHYQVVVVEGDARDEIVAYAQRHSVGHIVMGCRGLGMLKRALLGSVSDSVMHNAHCPVTVVRAPLQDKEDTPKTE